MPQRNLDAAKIFYPVKLDLFICPRKREMGNDLLLFMLSAYENKSLQCVLESPVNVTSCGLM